MRYKIFGNTGLRVSELCLGVMTFGAQGWGTDEKEAGQIYARFREAGGNFFDTANEIYGGGRSEEILGALISPHRDDMVLASKYSLGLPGGTNANQGGNHRKSLKRSVESSLKRLNTDYIDLLWVHAWDHRTPVEEMMRALDDLVSQGKVLYTGISNAPAWVVAKANTLAACHGWTSFAGIQVEYNLLERSIEQDLIPMAEDFGLTVAAWSPLASGVLSGKYARREGGARRLDIEAMQRLRALDDQVLSVASAVDEIAQRLGRSSAQVALNWLRAQSGVIPLLGVRTIEQLEDNLGCLDFQLDGDVIAQLSELTAPVLLHPHNYLANNQEIITAGFATKIDS